jgi:hypothetical protein
LGAVAGAGQERRSTVTGDQRGRVLLASLRTSNLPFGLKEASPTCTRDTKASTGLPAPAGDTLCAQGHSKWIIPGQQVLPRKSKCRSVRCIAKSRNLESQGQVDVVTYLPGNISKIPLVLEPQDIQRENWVEGRGSHVELS